MSIVDKNCYILQFLQNFSFFAWCVCICYNPDKQRFEHQSVIQTIFKYIALALCFTLIICIFQAGSDGLLRLSRPYDCCTYLLCPLLIFLELRARRRQMIQFLNGIVQHYNKYFTLSPIEISIHGYIVLSLTLKIVLLLSFTVNFILVRGDLESAIELNILKLFTLFAVTPLHTVSTSVTLVLAYLVEFEAGLNVTLEAMLFEVSSNDLYCMLWRTRLHKIHKLADSVKSISLHCIKCLKLLTEFQNLVAHMMIMIGFTLMSFIVTNQIKQAASYGTLLKEITFHYVFSVLDILYIAVCYKRLRV